MSDSDYSCSVNDSDGSAGVVNGVDVAISNTDSENSVEGSKGSRAEHAAKPSADI